MRIVIFPSEYPTNPPASVASPFPPTILTEEFELLISQNFLHLIPQFLLPQHNQN
jgi:hypothetical protein